MTSEEILEAWPEFVLRAPATAAEIASAETRLKFEFPLELRQLLLVSDGLLVRNPYLPPEAPAELALNSCDAIVQNTELLRSEWNPTAEWNANQRNHFNGDLSTILVIGGDGGENYCGYQMREDGSYELVLLHNELRVARPAECKTLLDFLPNLDPFERD